MSKGDPAMLDPRRAQGSGESDSSSLVPLGGALVAAFLLVGLVDSYLLQLYREYRGFHLDLWEAVARNLPFWLLWIPLAFPVLWIGHQRPVSLSSFSFGRAGLHLAVGLALALVHLAAWVWVRDYLAHGNFPPSDFSYLMGKFFAERIGIDLLVYGSLVGLGAQGLPWLGGGDGPGGETSATNDDQLVVEASGRTYVISRRATVWVEAEGDYMRIHGDRELLVRITMKELDRLLGPGFARVNRSALVSLEHIRELRPTPGDRWEAVLATGVRVPVTPTYRHRLKTLLVETG